MDIGLVYDLRSQYLAEGYSEEVIAEFDFDETVAALADVIASCGHKVDLIGRGKDLARRLVNGDRWDLVFTIAEGLQGRSREAQVPALLEMYDIPYTFSDPLVCAATLDKSIAKRLLVSYALPTPRFALIQKAEDLDGIQLDYPLFVKPVAEGTGKGIDARSRVDTPEALRVATLAVLECHQQPALVEEYLPGREFTTAILGTGAQAHTIGTMEIRILDNAPTNDYTFDIKEQCDSYCVYKPLQPGALLEAVEDLALSSYRALECRDAGRVDMRLDRHGKPAFMEVNPLPGMHPTHSDLPIIATQQGIAFKDLVSAIIDSAAQRITKAAKAP